MTTAEIDSYWMRRALTLAARGEGLVEPNPLVGCVIVEPKTNELIGSGFHVEFGKAHAERAALDDALLHGNEKRLRGSSAYVTLEPCCHFGKTPPCTKALIGAGIARVVVAQLDPFPAVCGSGIAELTDAGIEVTVGCEQAAALRLNAPYRKRLEKKRPWVIAKWAMSLDGKIATRTGDSQWISGEVSRTRVHELRGRVDAILIGSQTALADNPLLTARTNVPPLRKALRIVMDSRLRIPINFRLVETARETPVLLVAGPDALPEKAEQLRQLGCLVFCSTLSDPNARLEELLQTLATEHSVTNLLVEGGGLLVGSLLQLGQVDQCEVFIAPKLIGGKDAPSPIGGLGISHLRDCLTANSCSVQPSGEDTQISLRLN